MCLKVEKCKFACSYSEVPFLGQCVGREGLKMDPKKVQAISNIAYPTSKKEVRSLLGMAGYYRTFIPDFAGIGMLKMFQLRNKLNKQWTSLHQHSAQCSAISKFQRTFHTGN